MPLIVREPRSDALRELLEQDAGMVVWWATHVECVSAISRRTREGTLSTRGGASVRKLLNDLSESWTEVRPTARLRTLAEQSLITHPLRAADALQLAAALIWCGELPQGRPFVCLDDRLRNAASRFGFTLLPDSVTQPPAYPP
jgi:predicted nucleic acid-binding protein